MLAAVANSINNVSNQSVRESTGAQPSRLLGFVSNPDGKRGRLRSAQVADARAPDTAYAGRLPELLAQPSRCLKHPKVDPDESLKGLTSEQLSLV